VVGVNSRTSLGTGVIARALAIGEGRETITVPDEARGGNPASNACDPAESPIRARGAVP
jgi:hypothetical protein